MPDDTGRATMIDVAFFQMHAGWSYALDVEHEDVGRLAGAVRLARAEAHARHRGWVVEWDIDPDVDSSDHSDEQPPYPLWECILWPSDPSDAGEPPPLAGMGAIDLGREGRPDGSDYARVIEAELAAEALDAYPSEHMPRWH